MKVTSPVTTPQGHIIQVHLQSLWLRRQRAPLRYLAIRLQSSSPCQTFCVAESNRSVVMKTTCATITPSAISKFLENLTTWFNVLWHRDDRFRSYPDSFCRFDTAPLLQKPRSGLLSWWTALPSECFESYEAVVSPSCLT